MIQRVGRAGIHHTHAVALVEHPVVAAGIAVAKGVEPIFLQLLAVVIQQVETLQLGSRGNPLGPDGVVHRRNKAGDRGAVGRIRIGRCRVIAAGHHVFRTRTHVVRQIRVGDGQTIIHHGHIDSLAQHAGAMSPPEVEIIARYAATGAESILPAVEQIPLLILQGIGTWQAALGAVASDIHAALLAGERRTTFICLNERTGQGRQQCCDRQC